MKPQFYWVLLLFVLALSCQKEDNNMEEEMNNPDPFFQATFQWQPEFLTLLETEADSLPSEIDFTFDNSIDIEREDAESLNVSNFALIIPPSDDPEDDDSHIIYALQVDNGDTTAITFSLYGALEESTYDYTSIDIFDALFNGSIETPPNGSLIPFIFGTQSELSGFVSFAIFNGEVDMTGSTFEITEYDEENGTYSGEFSFDWKLIDEQTTIPMLKIENGAFAGLKVID